MKPAQPEKQRNNAGAELRFTTGVDESAEHPEAALYRQVTATPDVNIFKIDNEAPFAGSIYWWLVGHEADAPGLVKNSRRYEANYIAWQSVRKARNPFFENGTGFEGYLVGICRSPDEALEEILTICEGMLASTTRLHRFDYGFRSRLMHTLTGEHDDLEAMREWAALFGESLARLHSRARGNEYATCFRRETYDIIRQFPAIAYRADHDQVQQEYFVGRSLSDRFHTAPVTPTTLKPAEQDQWQVAQTIGKFGHPLLREYLRHPDP